MAASQPPIPRIDFDLAFPRLGRELVAIEDGVAVVPLALDVCPLTGELTLLLLPETYWLGPN